MVSTRSKTAAIVASLGVLGAGWQLGTANGQTLTSTASTTSTTTSTPSASTSTDSARTSSSNGNTTTTSSSSTSTSSTTSKTTTTKASGTYTGQTVSERYGTVTVTVTLSNGKITDVSAQTTVRESRSQMYVNRALPVLRQEVLAANSAKVSMVSGATFTSSAYLTSLQSALDQA